MKRTVLSAASLLVLASCSEAEMENMATELASDDAVGQEQVCAGEFAQRYDIDRNSVRVNSRDTAASGNAMIFLQSGDTSASCEVDRNMNVVALTTFFWAEAADA